MLNKVLLVTVDLNKRKGVIETANQAIETAQKILKLFTEDHKNIETIGKPSASTLIIHSYLQKHP